EFRRRHLWALIAMAGYLLALAAIKLLFLGPMEPIRLDPPDGRAAVVITPLTATYFYLLAAFSFGLAGDLGARPSIYPARMFALPVRTAALVGWPMLYGTAAVAILWLVTALSARWPWGIELPLIWPALLAAVFLAWTQALMWMPYGLPGLRAIVTVPWLATLDAVALLAIHYRVREPMMVAFLAPQLPLAYVTACSAVGRARRCNAAVHGRLHGVDREPAESPGARFLRRAAVHRDAAVDQRRAHRGEAQDGDMEHPGGVAAGARRAAARARVVGHLAPRDGTG